ncbi:gamma-butyrobetaine hydroxylase-like domain-containing protein [Aurantimonas sp. VKM B-3413]|uniref:gamma-butyrobetaine hydroxylase-like domain-containing protein n=1 Tax=Aurantimonas sp. VKM B-3413 TaxID=2779401 RepID=UPI001E4726DD|nr:DUF971 domain-containing protein [Aurantimonas sp. VKM B-3413]MCB8839228.1 DUF971 domain-containing protein [Aurantimonas sp. VKM B-3413]
MTESSPAPEELRVGADRRTLVVVFPGGARDEFSAEFLRVLSPSAEVQGHSPDQRKTVGGKKDVAIANILPIGHYAIRIVFSDGHDSGIYTWSYLAELGREKDERWRAYLEELKAKGLKRER